MVKINHQAGLVIQISNHIIMLARAEPFSPAKCDNFFHLFQSLHLTLSLSLSLHAKLHKTFVIEKSMDLAPCLYAENSHRFWHVLRLPGPDLSIN